MKNTDGSFEEMFGDQPEDIIEKLNRLEDKTDELELLLLGLKEKLSYINFVLGGWTIVGGLLVAKYTFGRTFPWE
jgi:hypothetical protein